ncbi:unnamed protein product [Arabis nemorensis]|uniref:Uncharacterized protein n=1 Tax=Arabis nemorensis TaxID=586526 RepID=A0A565BRB1_9BRAS|nr:unnamed protein product [Arabis nemorensis]
MINGRARTKIKGDEVFLIAKREDDLIGVLGNGLRCERRGSDTTKPSGSRMQVDGEDFLPYCLVISPPPKFLLTVLVQKRNAETAIEIAYTDSVTRDIRGNKRWGWDELEHLCMNIENYELGFMCWKSFSISRRDPVE